MTACPSFAGEGAVGIAAALRAIDCRTGEATSFAFDRLFGADGRLLGALTILLTLYVAFYAIALLTGRARVGVAALTPRMMTLGLVLTFATSWAAYQSVIWTLTTGAPDQIATVIAGTRGSATIAFADRLDTLFAAVAEIADEASKPAAATDTGVTPATPMVGGFTSGTVLWLSALLLLLGTVGVLVTAKVALGALLALGPVFITLALFGGTRGLFEGWLKGVVLFAVVPLFAVLIGGGAVAMIEPVVQALAMEGEQASSRGVATLFLGSTVYVALMVMALKTAATLVAGWRLPGSRDTMRGSNPGMAAAAPLLPHASGSAVSAQQAAGTAASGGDDRVRVMLAGMHGGMAGQAAETTPQRSRASAEIIPIHGAARPHRAADSRAQSIGTRFRSRPLAAGRGRIT